MAQKDDTPMTPEETKAYILAHHKEQTKLEMAAACHKGFDTIHNLCWQMGIHAVTATDRKVAILRAAGGQKTARELAKLTGLSVERTRRACHEHNIPFLASPVGGAAPRIEKKEEDISELSEEKRKELLEMHIARYTKKGFSRFEALKILHEIAEYLMTFGEWKKSTIERPKAIYANQTRDQLIEELLRDEKSPD